ncbi:MAG: hypothetical protein QM606_01645, partial [Leucobacter sp.]
MTELEHISTIALYSAMIVYAIAFVFYVVDLANRSGDAVIARQAARGAGAEAAPGSVEAGSRASVRAEAAAGSRAGGTATLVRSAAPAQARSRSKAGGAVRQPRSRSLRIGFSLTVLAFVLHLSATVLRGIGAGRVPW